MELEELENSLNELDQRVERVRSLYEQYFMGIEKLEPTVLRKDIDRRFWILRREQIRNTAMRFKLNTVSQRYNTYQQYWARILREIDQGTYRRHVRKAEQRFGAEALTIATRRRRGQTSQDVEQARSAAAEKAERALSQTPDIDACEVEVDVGEFSYIDDIDDLLAPRSAPRFDTRPRTMPPQLDELDDLESLMGMGASPSHPPKAQAAAVPRPMRGGPASPSAQQGGDADFGMLGGVFAEAEADQTQPRQMHRVDPAGRTAAQPAPARPAPSRLQPPPPPRPQAPSRLQPPPPPRLQAPAPSPQAQSRLQPPPPPRAPARTRSQPPQAPGPQAPAGTPPPRAPTRSRPPQAADPQAPVRSPPPQAPTRPQPYQSTLGRSARRAQDALSDNRVRQIYREYVQAKRNCNESTSSITEDALASTLRDSAAKLRSKHKGKQVDFDVVIKDGKAVLKPIVKS